jgi:hypothetical protein
MRHSLLLFTALIAPAHAELHELEQTEIHSHALPNIAAQTSLAPSSGLFEPSLCWLPVSTPGQIGAVEIDNCVTQAIYSSGLNRQKPNEVRGLQALNWSVMNYPAISSGAWSFIPDIGYQLLQEKSPEPQAGLQYVNTDNEKPMSAMPLATATWFVLGGMLGSLAMVRRNQEKLAVVRA